jgi:hypothetical protein
LLKVIEGLGLINMKSPVPQTAEKADQEETPSYHRLRGIHKGIPGASVEDFFARCREDKEHELKIERRQEEERARRAGIHLDTSESLPYSLLRVTPWLILRSW